MSTNGRRELETLVGFHAEGSTRLVLRLHRSLVGVDEPLRFVISLENDMGHDLVAHVPLSAVQVSATDESGELPIEAVGARPGLPHAVRVGRASIGAARLCVEPADGALIGALGCAVPFVVADERDAAARAALPSHSNRTSTRVVEIGGALSGRPLRLSESRDGVYSQLWDAGLGLARYLAAAPPDEWLGACSEWRAADGSAEGPLAGLRVLELGAGTGVTALALAALGARVRATDMAEGSISLLRSNARANGLEKALEAAQLAWGADCGLLREPIHLVVGADVVYIEDCFVPLVGTLRAAVSRGAVGLLAYRRRCEPGVEAHFFHLLQASLHVQRLAHAQVGLGVALYRLTPRPGGGGSGGETRGGEGAQCCQYCEFLRAKWARRFCEERAQSRGEDAAVAWSPTDLLV